MFRKLRFLVLIAALVALPLMAGIGCSNSSDLTFTSTQVQDHTHRVTISGDDISSDNTSNVPTTSKTLETTESGSPAHSHTITLTPDNYRALSQGREVLALTSLEENHAHIFDLQKGKEGQTPSENATTGGTGGY